MARRPWQGRYCVWCSLTVFVSVVAIFGYFMRRDITHAAECVAQLELEVNSRAGEKLLRWETNGAATKLASGADALAPKRRDRPRPSAPFSTGQSAAYRPVSDPSSCRVTSEAAGTYEVENNG